MYCAIWDEIRIKGKLEQQISTLLIILKFKLGGYISSYLTKEIENSNLETLEVLTTRILDVENEDDVIKVLHHNF